MTLQRADRERPHPLERFAGLAMMAAIMTTCASPDSPETEHHHEPTSSDHGDDHAGDDQDDEIYDRGAFSRLRGRRCEHRVPILECDECRYEVGAVEVAASLLDPAGDDLIRTAKVASTPRQEELILNGEVAFDDRRVAHVSPRVGGVVQQAFVALGDTVEQRAKLVAMDSPELGKLRSNFLQAQARVELAQKNLDREERLHQQRISSGRDRLQADVTHRESQIELAAAREQLRLLGLSGRGSGIGGGSTILTAPVSGRVVSMHAVKGEQVSPEESVVTIADLSRLWVWADLYERDLGTIITASAAGDLEATVEVAAFPGRRFTGAVDYVGATMEEATRTIKVRVEVRNDDELLRPGMFAKVSVALDGSAALLVPDEALVDQEGQSFVFVRAGPRLFLRRDVTARPVRGGLVALLDGVDEGEEIVIRGAFLLKSDVLREQMGAGCAD